MAIGVREGKGRAGNHGNRHNDRGSRGIPRKYENGQSDLSRSSVGLFFSIR